MFYSFFILLLFLFFFLDAKIPPPDLASFLPLLFFPLESACPPSLRLPLMTVFLSLSSPFSLFLYPAFFPASLLLFSGFLTRASAFCARLPYSSPSRQKNLVRFFLPNRPPFFFIFFFRSVRHFFSATELIDHQFPPQEDQFFFSSRAPVFRFYFFQSLPL